MMAASREGELMATAAATSDLNGAIRALDPMIRAHADAAEAEREVPRAVIDAMREARLFDMVLPRSLGGGETDVITMMRVIETASVADGATGWTLGIGAGTTSVAAYLRDDVAREMFAPGVIWGGPIAPSGRAVIAEGGYRVTGRWSFASGCQHCDWLVAGTLVFDGDKRRVTDAGAPDFRLATFPVSDVEIIDTWRTTGLRGTGSHDIAVKDVFVPFDRTVAIAADRPVQEGALYRFPIFSLLAYTIAPVATGMARRALDEFTALSETKKPVFSGSTLRDRAIVQYEIAQAEARLRSARAFMYEAAAEAWDVVSAGNKLTIRDKATLRLSAAHAAIESAKVIDTAYTLAGSSSVYDGSILQRLFRDVHTATQHVSLNAANYETAGRVLLGLDPNTPML